MHIQRGIRTTLRTYKHTPIRISRYKPNKSNMLFLNTLFSTLSILLLSTSLISASPTGALRPRYLPQGTITSPANGTHIAPGASFAFSYAARGDYCLGSQNFTVWLLTSKDAPDSAAALFAGINGNGGIGDDSNAPTGYYFGRFAYSSNSK